MSIGGGTSARRICVFCGSSTGCRPIYADAARVLGQLLAQRGIGLVYGGGRLGLMGVLADAVLASGGEVIGVIPQAMVQQERGHTGLTELRVVSSMHERKATMSELAAAFVALPGGFGTLEEFCEVLTWTQLGLHRKPCGILNVCGYFDALLKLFDHAVEERFLRPEHRQLVLADEDAASLVDRLWQFEVPVVEK
jgi:uncharacterized protein (TIGR00730 family)